MFFLMFVKREFIITNEVSDQLVHEEQTDQKLFFFVGANNLSKKKHTKKKKYFHHKDTPGNFLNWHDWLT